MTRELLIFAALILPLGNFVEAQTPANLRTDRLLGNVKTVRTERTWTTKHIESKRVLMTVETYDRQGNKTEWDAYMGSDKPTRDLFTYDAKDHATEQVWYDSAEQLRGKTLFTYDAKGNLIEENASNGVRILYKYDSRNN
jgi:hypothetical protein